MQTFEVTARDNGTAARCGVLRTAHGEVKTPVFMPVGTKGTVKAISPRDLEEMGFSLILANTYHLYLRPGMEVIREAGGLHAFTAWKGAILTDSGGYQIFSLSKTLSLQEEGVSFRSVYDGREVFLTPEEVTLAQQAMGSDIAMVLDECVPYPCDRRYVEESVMLTYRWARRCQRVHDRPDQLLFGIVQGGVYHDLRKRSAELTSELGFPGFAIGGLSVGEPQELMFELLGEQTALLPHDKPRYLMGVGDPEGIVEAVCLGVDMFDCVLPTRLARNGAAMTREGRINLRNSVYARDLAPLEEDCSCYACRQFSRAYIRHLYQNNEILALILLTQHNLAFIQSLVDNCRSSIEAGKMDELKSTWKGWNGRHIKED
jgi:queuine tRNA-ribosyltransferase